MSKPTKQEMHDALEAFDASTETFAASMTLLRDAFRTAFDAFATFAGQLERHGLLEDDRQLNLPDVDTNPTESEEPEFVRLIGGKLDTKNVEVLQRFMSNLSREDFESIEIEDEDEDDALLSAEIERCDSVFAVATNPTRAQRHKRLADWMRELRHRRKIMGETYDPSIIVDERGES